MRGYVSHKAELQGHLDLNTPKPHLVALNETHLQRTVAELTLGGYSLVSRLDRRDGRQKGGIALFALPEVASCITMLEHAVDDTHERSWHVIHADLGPILLCIWYRPPCPGEISSIVAFEAEWVRLSPGYLGTFVVGDINVHHSHWLKFSSSVSMEGTRLYRFCQDNGFRQLVKEPTHEAGHLLDLGLTDLVEVESASVLPKIADHNVVRFVMKLSVPAEAPRSRTVFDYQKAPWQQICDEIRSLDWSWINECDVDAATVRFTDDLLRILDANVPSKTICDRAALHPWYNDRCRALVREKRKAEGRDDYKGASERCSRGLFEEYCKYVEKMREKLKSLRRGSKQWWRITNQLMDKSKVSSGIPALKDGDDWILDATDKANLLERTFAAKCVLPDAVTNEYSALLPPVLRGGFLRIRLRDVEVVLKALVEDSATGPDNLATRVLKHCASTLSWPLTLLARRIVRTRRWPQLWIAHWITALHKKKSVYSALHYRGVHLTAQASKVIERVLGRHLFPPLVERAFGDAQFAYRPKLGARDAVLVYVATWLHMMNKGKKIGVYCSDVSGAFDKVSAARLLQKLAAHGLHADLLAVVQSWLRDRQAFVVVAGERSAGTTLSNMVYQGTVWGPTLWNVFVGDVVVVFESVGYSIVIYADDINAFKAFDRSVPNSAVFDDLKRRQVELHRWGFANQVTFDAGKESFTVLSTTDAEGEDFKVLGIDFDAKLTMRHCIQTCVAEAGWRYRTLLRTRRFYNDSELVGLFKAHILSFVEYRTPGVYHAASSNILALDRVLSNFLRQVNVSELEALTNFKLAPLSARRDVAMLGVIHRTLLGEGPPQLRVFFRLDETNLRRSARITRHERQIVSNFGDRPLDMVKRSVLGLTRVYNMLPAHVVKCKSVRSFQGALQELLCEQAVAGRPEWQYLFSPRWAIQSHPLLHM